MRKWVTNILLIIFATIFLVSGYFLVDYFLESGKQQDSFNDLASIMNNATQPQADPEGTNAPDAPTLPDGEPLEDPDALVQITDPETGETIELLPEFSELYLMNNDLIGWMTIEGTEVNYPVMQTPDSKDYYLRRDFYEQYSSHGCIYAQETCDVWEPSDNVTIYGHRMNDGSMFNNLRFYESKDFWEEHKYIQFNTLQERHTYEIFAVFTIAANLDSPFQYHMFIDAADEEHYNEFIDNCQSYALYDTGIIPEYGEKLITLSTCEYSQTNGRLVVVARRID